LVTHGLTSHRTSVAFGGALERCYVHRPSFVTVQARDASGVNCRVGGDNFSVKLRGPIKDLVASVHDRDDGTYVAEFTAPVTGEYALLVLLDGRHIHGSPFVLRVGSGAAHGPSCVLLEAAGEKGGFPSRAHDGVAPSSAPLTSPRPPLVAGVEMRFVLEAHDERGGRITHGGEHVQAWLQPAPDAQPAAVASLVGGPHARAPPELAIDDRGDGTYLVRLRVYVAGPYELHVLLGARAAEERIGGTPLALRVVPGPACAPATTLHVLSPSGVPMPHGTPFAPVHAGEETSFMLLANDSYGNACGRGGGRFEMAVEHSTSADARDDFFVATDLVDHADGRYSGSLRAGRAGEALLRVSLDGAPIGTPFVVPIVSGPTCAACCRVRVARASLDAHADPHRWAALHASAPLGKGAALGCPPQRVGQPAGAGRGFGAAGTSPSAPNTARGFGAAGTSPSAPLPQLTMGVGETAEALIEAYDAYGNPRGRGALTGTEWPLNATECL